MKKIYNYFINNEKYIKNKNVPPEIENSLKQGNALLKSRRKFLNNLEYNLSHYNRNIVEGFKEGLTDLSGFSDDDAKIITKKMADFTEKKKSYNTKLETYETTYTDFITEFDALKKKVVNCERNCISQSNKDACRAGCVFRGPYIKEAENTFIEDDTYKCPTDEVDCTTSTGAQDSKGTTKMTGCIICGGGRFGKQKYLLNNDKYIKNCSYFIDEENTICNAADKAPTVEEQTGIVAKYTSLSTINQELLTLSDEILEIVKTLKDYNINLMNDKSMLLSEYQEEAVSYKFIQNEIAKFTKKNKLTLDMKVGDSVLKKKAYDLRIYIWLILALGLGFAALNKIRRF
jgi:hypothetical protein